jgi:hypothetical protein
MDHEPLNGSSNVIVIHSSPTRKRARQPAYDGSANKRKHRGDTNAQQDFDENKRHPRSINQPASMTASVAATETACRTLRRRGSGAVLTADNTVVLAHRSACRSYSRQTHTNTRPVLPLSVQTKLLAAFGSDAQTVHRIRTPARTDPPRHPAPDAGGGLSTRAWA